VCKNIRRESRHWETNTFLLSSPKKTKKHALPKREEWEEEKRKGRLDASGRREHIFGFLPFSWRDEKVRDGKREDGLKGWV
jgi:hypothetical protein